MNSSTICEYILQTSKIKASFVLYLEEICLEKTEMRSRIVWNCVAVCRGEICNIKIIAFIKTKVVNNEGEMWNLF